MKKSILFLILFCLPIYVCGQKSEFKGFYQARFFNLFEEVKVILIDFEVAEDGSLKGNIKSGNDRKIITGNVERNGKFEARTVAENNTATIFKGELPVTENAGKVFLIWRSEQRGKGYKSISENKIEGFLQSVLPPVQSKDAGVADSGKTLLWFQHSNPLFGKEWKDLSAAVKNADDGKSGYEVILESKSDDAERSFRLKLNCRRESCKTWSGNDLSVASYREKKIADGKTSAYNSFPVFADKTGGQVEIIRETEKEIVFRLTNLMLKKIGKDEFVQIDGYLYAKKT